jgi:hypothetical protein
MFSPVVGLLSTTTLTGKAGDHPLIYICVR